MADRVVLDLPPVGEPDVNGFLAVYTNNLRNQDVMSRGIYISTQETALNLYLHGQESPGSDPDDIYVVNKTQPTINTFIELATRTPPVITLKSTGVGDGGFPVITTAGETVMLDDAAIVAYTQTIFDNKWEEDDKGPIFFFNMVRNSQIYGWQDALIEWDGLLGGPIFTILPNVQWYKDATVESVSDMQHVGVDWPMDAQLAKRKWPEIAPQIDEWATRTLGYLPGSAGYSSVYQSVTLQTPYVTIGTFWMRNHEMPMTDQEAIASGLVEARPVAKELPNELPDAGGIADDSGNLGAAEGQPQGSGEDAGADTEPAAETETGIEPVAAGTGPGDQANIPTESVTLILVETGEEVDEKSPNWPRKLVTRRVTEISTINRVVENITETAWDIPVVTCYNVGIPNRPFGQPSPILTAGLQRDYNTIQGTAIKHAHWFKGPTIIADMSIRDELPDEAAKNIGMEPNKTYYCNMNGRSVKESIAVIEPPELPSVILTVKHEISEDFDYAQSRPAALQGQTPTSDASGKLAETLQAAGASAAGFKFHSAQQMLWRTARLVLGYIPMYLTAEQMFEINRTYDVQTIQQFIIPRQRTLKWGIDVEVSGGASKQIRDANTRADFAAGIIDRETAQERLMYDPKLIAAREQKAMAGQPQPQNGDGNVEPASEPARKSPARRVLS